MDIKNILATFHKLSSTTQSPAGGSFVPVAESALPPDVKIKSMKLHDGTSIKQLLVGNQHVGSWWRNELQNWESESAKTGMTHEHSSEAQAVQALLDQVGSPLKAAAVLSKSVMDEGVVWEPEDDFELHNGDRVRVKGEGNEIFTVSQYEPGGRRCWIGDKQGRGWFISPSRLEKVDDMDDDYENDELDENTAITCSDCQSEPCICYGSPFDCGDTDHYYGRKPNPHKLVLTDLDFAEVKNGGTAEDYRKGYKLGKKYQNPKSPELSLYVTARGAAAAGVRDALAGKPYQPHSSEWKEDKNLTSDEKTSYMKGYKSGTSGKKDWGSEPKVSKFDPEDPFAESREFSNKPSDFGHCGSCGQKSHLDYDTGMCVDCLDKTAKSLGYKDYHAVTDAPLSKSCSVCGSNPCECSELEEGAWGATIGAAAGEMLAPELTPLSGAVGAAIGSKIGDQFTDEEEEMEESQMNESRVKNYYAVATAAIKKKYGLDQKKTPVDLTDAQTTEAHKLARKLKADDKKKTEESYQHALAELKRLSECCDGMNMTPQEPPNMNVTTNIDGKTGNKTVTVSADGAGADELMQILQMAGISVAPTAPAAAQSMEEEATNHPAPQTLDAQTMLNQGEDLNKIKGQYNPDRGRDNSMSMVDEAVEQLAETLRRRFYSEQ
jgi:hypothetical protein